MKPGKLVQKGIVAHLGEFGTRTVITSMLYEKPSMSRPVNFKYGNAICYSGYREGQSPAAEVFPTYEQVREDLLILNRYWHYIRIYDPNKHAELVLEVIRREKMDLKVMIGMCLFAEMNNKDCPWDGGHLTPEQMAANQALNRLQVEKLILLANRYPDSVFAISAGNEATVNWSDHQVPVESIIEYVRTIKQRTSQPVTFCENYVPWLGKLSKLGEEIDFISLHTYPIWESIGIEDALQYTIENYESVKEIYLDKTIVITEAGWATRSNGRGIPPQNANEDFQKQYYESLVRWSQENGILTFVFEAFDEEWKGSPEPLEPEKHWGLFTIERKPKKVMLETWMMEQQ
jgi:exo-beta-1,3-glucanase (GH17 family)